MRVVIAVLVALALTLSASPALAALPDDPGYCGARPNC